MKKGERLKGFQGQICDKMFETVIHVSGYNLENIDTSVMYEMYEYNGLYASQAYFIHPTCGHGPDTLFPSRDSLLALVFPIYR